MDTKALRQKILDLAVRGKLVPQNPDDEPARVLLERIRAEKKQMVKDGRLKAKDIKNDSVIYFKEDNLPYEQFADGTEKCITDEIPFELPDGWEWARLKNICFMIAGKSKNKNEIKQEPFSQCYPCYGGNGHRGYTDTFNYNGKYSIVGRQGALCGNINIANGKFYATEHAVVVILYTNIDFDWNNYTLKALNLNQYATGAAQPGLAVANILNVLVPVPPFEEQKRIADKINELMGLVDVIEQNKTDLQTAVKLAKEKILDLAIRGQLVPQNPDDEPASVLLERIRAEKQQLIKQGKIKPDKKDTVTFTDDELPFELPDGWEWCRLGNLCSVISKGTTPKGGKSCYLDSGINYLRVENIMDNGQIDTSDMVHIDEKIHNTELKRSILQEDDLLITIAGTLGKTAVVHKNNLPLNTNQAISFSRLINVNLCFVDFLRLIISSKIIQNRLLLKTKVTSIPNLTLEIISDCLIPLPPLNEQKRIADKINQLFSMLDSITEFLN